MKSCGFEDLVKRINWPLLRKQKALLIKLAEQDEYRSLDGIVHLLDDIMDSAVELNIASEKAVFGTRHA